MLTTAFCVAVDSSATNGNLAEFIKLELGTGSSLVWSVRCRDLPQIIDYIRVKADIGDLEKKAIDWQRKIEIAGESLPH